NDQHDPTRWSHGSYSDQLHVIASELELTTKILWVPNIASAQVKPHVRIRGGCRRVDHVDVLRVRVMWARGWAHRPVMRTFDAG
ncbi:hypothetical protein ABZ468_45180, partial [Streptomyces sp. NPDC005708]|uniref:hypothetical protein n=1 Tax=Streptomyces sp. NPDC005708 TaxID=3154564 RepID=UPI0033DAA722